MVWRKNWPLFGPSTRPLRRWKSDAEKTMSMWLKKGPIQASILFIIAFPADALLKINS